MTGVEATTPDVVLDGVRLRAITERRCIEHILDELDAGRGGWVVTANLAILRQLSRDAELRELIAGVSMCVADGMPLVWASRLAGAPLPERVAGSDLIDSLSGAASQRDRSVYLLGGNPGAAEAAAEVLSQRYPSLRIAGTYCPPIGFEQDNDELERMAGALDAAEPDIVYVALGFPKQERLIARLRAERPSAWWLGVGISMSFVSGEVRRAPRWMRRLGLEWVHRLCQEPGRLLGRYSRDIPYGLGLLWRAMRGRDCGAAPTVTESKDVR